MSFSWRAISGQLPAVRTTVREEARDHIRLRVGIFAHVVGLLEDPALLGGIGLKSTAVAPKEITESRHLFHFGVRRGDYVRVYAKELEICCLKITALRSLGHRFWYAAGPWAATRLVTAVNLA